MYRKLCENAYVWPSANVTSTSSFLRLTFVTDELFMRPKMHNLRSLGCFAFAVAVVTEDSLCQYARLTEQYRVFAEQKYAEARPIFRTPNV